jgi:hypothetical protein
MIKWILLLIALIVLLVIRRKRHFLSIIAIFKNESMNFKEYIEHYMWQGVDHFYFIDNGSTDDYMSVIKPYMSKITIFKRPEKWQQVKITNEVFQSVKHESEWFMIIDLDEFCFESSGKSNIKEYLKNLPADVSQVYLRMLMFGSRDEYEHPPSIRKAFTWREKDICMGGGKAIIKSDKTIDFSVHQFNTTGKMIVETDKLHFNHYRLQSKEYFDKVKRTRGDVNLPNGENERDDKYFKDNDKREFEDTLIRDILNAQE